ncbi:MAG: hypothetical protein RR313_12040, partial [Anaerovoracaceae bacterium]
AHILLDYVTIKHISQLFANPQMESAHWRVFLIDSVSKSGNYFFRVLISGFLHFFIVHFSTFQFFPFQKGLKPRCYWLAA